MASRLFHFTEKETEEIDIFPRVNSDPGDRFQYFVLAALPIIGTKIPDKGKGRDEGLIFALSLR